MKVSGRKETAGDWKEICNERLLEIHQESIGGGGGEREIGREVASSFALNLCPPSTHPSPSLQKCIDWNRDILKEELGLTEEDIIDIPQLFSPYSAGKALALFPDMVRPWRGTGRILLLQPGEGKGVKFRGLRCISSCLRHLYHYYTAEL